MIYFLFLINYQVERLEIRVLFKTLIYSSIQLLNCAPSYLIKVAFDVEQ